MTSLARGDIVLLAVHGKTLRACVLKVACHGRSVWCTDFATFGAWVQVSDCQWLASPYRDQPLTVSHDTLAGYFRGLST
jgi:hypothetical protein